MEFETYDEALANQVLCMTCGKPKKEIVGIHQYGQPSRYVLQRCKRRRCTIHCSKWDGCSHVR